MAEKTTKKATAKRAPARTTAAKKTATTKAPPAKQAPAKKATATRKSHTFADKAGDIAEDVQALVADTRERLGEIAQAHAELHSSAEPGAGQEALWAAFRRVTATFEDIDRVLGQAASTAVDLTRAVVASDA